MRSAKATGRPTSRLKSACSTAASAPAKRDGAKRSDAAQPLPRWQPGLAGGVRTRLESLVRARTCRSCQRRRGAGARPDRLALQHAQPGRTVSATWPGRDRAADARAWHGAGGADQGGTQRVGGGRRNGDGRGPAPFRGLLAGAPGGIFQWRGIGDAARDASGSNAACPAMSTVSY